MLLKGPNPWGSGCAHATTWFGGGGELPPPPPPPPRFHSPLNDRKDGCPETIERGPDWSRNKLGVVRHLNQPTETGAALNRYSHSTFQLLIAERCLWHN